MVSSFFSRSKPINFIVVGVYMAFFYVFAQYTPTFTMTITAIGKRIGGLLLYIITMLILNYITQKNDLSRKNTYVILLFAFLTAIVPNALDRLDIIISNFFVLLGLRKILNLKNPKDVKHKIFDATMCIGIASLFYFWSILFMSIVFFGILSFVSENYKHWIIPSIALFVVYILANCFTLVWEDSFFLFSDYAAPMSLDFSSYLIANTLFSLGITMICVVFFFVVYGIKSKQESTQRKLAMKLMIVHVCIGITITILTPIKDTSSLFFIAAPLAVIGTSYLRLSQHRLMKEINIWVFLILPILTLFL